MVSASDTTWPRIAVRDAAIVMRRGRGNTANMVASSNSVAEALRVTSAHLGAGTTNHDPNTMPRVRIAVVITSGPISVVLADIITNISISKIKNKTYLLTMEKCVKLN